MRRIVTALLILFAVAGCTDEFMPEGPDGGDTIQKAGTKAGISLSKIWGRRSEVVALNIYGSGTSFTTSSVVSISGTGISVTYNRRSSTWIEATFSILPLATYGPRTVTVTNCVGSSSCAATFTVYNSTASANPNYRFRTGTVTHTVTGTYTAFSSSSTSVTTSNSCMNAAYTYISATQATVVTSSPYYIHPITRERIYTECDPGAYTLTITTGTQVVTVPITVKEYPAITISPTSATDGDTVTIGVTGNASARFSSSNISAAFMINHFFYGLIVDPNIEIVSVTRHSYTYATVKAIFHDYGSTGSRTLRISNCDYLIGGICDASFIILSDSTPPSMSAVPNVIYQGDTPLLRFYGVNTHFSNNSTAVTNVTAPTGTMAQIRWPSPLPTGTFSPLTLDMQIGSTAPLGTATVKLNTNGEHVSGNIIIKEQPEIYLTPSSAQRGDEVVITVTGNDSIGFDPEETSLDTSLFDSNAEVLDSYVDGSDFKIYLRLHNYINTAGSYTIRIFNCEMNYGKTCEAQFSVVPDPTPPSLSVTPAYMFKGDTAQFAVSGTYTHFISGLTTITSSDPNVTAQFTLNQAAQTAVVTLTAASATTPGTKIFTFHTKGEHVSFPVLVKALPTISISPNTLTEGGQHLFTITGYNTNFNGTTVLTTSTPLLELSEIAITSGTSINLRAGVHDTIIAPANTSVYVANCDSLYHKSCVDKIYIEAYPAGTQPVISRVRPSEVERDTHAELRIDAANIDFNKCTPVIPSPAGTVISGITVQDPSVISADLFAQRDAALGTRDIEVHCGLRHMSYPSAFTVIRHPAVVTTPAPATLRQSEYINTAFSVDYVTCSEITGYSFPPESMLSISNYTCSNDGSVSDRANITMKIRADEYTPLGNHVLTILTTQGNVAPSFEVTRGVFLIGATPTSGKQGLSTKVTVRSKHFDWPADMSLSYITTTCTQTVIESAYRISNRVMEYTINPNLTSNIGTCTVSLNNIADAQGQSFTHNFTIVKNYADVPPQGTYTGLVTADSPMFVRISVTEGDVIKLRAERDILSSVDPVMTLAGDSGLFVPYIKQNDDEHGATYDSMIVYRAKQTGVHFIQIEDRLKINSGIVTFSYGTWNPEMIEEVTETVNPPVHNNDYENALSLNTTVTSWLARGYVDEDDPEDWYHIEVPAHWSGARVKLVSLDAFGTESGTSLTVEAYGIFENQGQTTLYQTASASSSGYSEDAEIFISRDTEFYIRVSNANSHAGTYYINVSPPVIVSEVSHDEDNCFTGSFVELYGSPGRDFNNCLLTLHGKNSGSDAALIYAQSLADGDYTYRTTSRGYFVAAADTMVPGVTEANIFEGMKPVCDENYDVYDSYKLSLICSIDNDPPQATDPALDTVCFGDEDPSFCADSLSSPSGETIGRGYNIYTNRTDEDFHVQPEMTPWQPSLVEVSR